MTPCPRGSLPLFCATWHDCLPYPTREQILDVWASRHRKAKEAPRSTRRSAA